MSDVVLVTHVVGGFSGPEHAGETHRLYPRPTDIRVLHTKADARNLDYAIELPADSIAFDQEALGWALKHMQDNPGAKAVAPAIAEEAPG